MTELTKRQREVLKFIQVTQARDGYSPTLREIAQHFGFKSPKAALRRKGVLTVQSRKARGMRVVSPWQKMLKPIVHIPIYGSIPAGFADVREQSAQACISIDVRTVGVRPTPRTFALEVRGDSMTGKGIFDGDVAVIEPGRTPNTGDVVAALIDNENTLKTFTMQNGRPVLRAENPKYPDLVPSSELVIQGVMIALIRKCGERR